MTDLSIIGALAAITLIAIGVLLAFTSAISWDTQTTFGAFGILLGAIGLFGGGIGSLIRRRA
ncbi:magnesium transporter accessory protein [Frankia sp. Mgl5]|uniref:magnesium transporter accessory protein n=1 Tax=Frankia sp. Mgl5 TaxID=2933793 RepID=UPI00200C8140|nr:magnesium transporter accessory protein [Frankia sp. Mgl5]MCK9927674.1 magnesium transporter accessory protein [Frankia sp. Mgl5]